MNNILYPFILTLMAGLSTVLGVIPILFNIKESFYNKFITFCLSFSIAIMISISIFDLIPTSFIQVYCKYSLSSTCLILLVSFLVGFIVISILSKLISREEHNNDLYKLGILNMIVLMLHNLPEGIATFLSGTTSITLGIKLSLAIALHNIPEGIAISVPIYYSTHSKSKAIKATLLSGLSEPLGAILAYIFLKNFVTDTIISIILIMVASLMITLSIEELFPKVIKYHETKAMYIGLVIGFIICIMSLVLSRI